MAFFTPIVGAGGGDDELTIAEELFVQGLEQLSYSEGDMLIHQSGSLLNRTAAQVRSHLNVEDGASADQTDTEIETAYNNRVSVVSQSVAEAGTSTTVYRWTPQRVAQAIAALAGSSSTNNYSATSDPTVGDDANDGYTIGSVWVNTVSDESFKCVDNTTGAAVWIKTSLTSDELATVALSGAYSDLTGIPSSFTPSAHTHTASDITDFDTEVSNNTDVAANTTARHDAVTIGTANGLSLAGQALSLATATTGAAGAMSAADKTKLDGIESGADVTDAAGVSTAGGMITVEHGATAGTARPSVSGPVYWIGSVEPTNASNGDVWVDTA